MKKVRPQAVFSRTVVGGLILCAMVFLLPATTAAHPEYAEKTGQVCVSCHIDENGGELAPTGTAYAAGGYRWPPPSDSRPIFPISKTARYLTGFVHLVAGFLWFGTILYVHLILRPAYAEKGLPRAEMLLGVLSMATVGISGIFLVLSKISDASIMFETKWGRVLSLKITLYLVLVSSAIVAVKIIGPRLKSRRVRAEHPADGVFDPATLSAFDGQNGKPAYLAFRGKVYDASNSAFWKGGTHFKHPAGANLTVAIGRAPHGPEKPETLPEVGIFDPERQPPKTPAQKVFYFFAYMNLFLVFTIIFIIAYWRWGI